MAYRFDALAGRVTKSMHIRPYFPITPRKVQNVDPPRMIWDTIKTKPVQVDTPGVANYSTKSTLSPRMAAKFESFKKVEQLDVYKAAGTRDKVLLGVILALFSYCGFHAAMFLSSKK